MGIACSTCSRGQPTRRPRGLDPVASQHGLSTSALPLAGIADVSEELLADVLDFGSFENMRRLENTRGTPLGALKKSSSGHPDAFKTRKGIVGGYEDYLQAETIAAIDRRVERDLPAAYGYHRHAD